MTIRSPIYTKIWQQDDWAGIEGLRFWTHSLTPPPVSGTFPVIEWQPFDLLKASPDTYSWGWSYNRNLIGKDKMLVGEQVTDLPPRDHPERYRSWTWQYNVNLVGKDQLPVGEVYTDRPPPLTWYQSWLLNLLQGTLTPTVALPFNEYDWPLPRTPQQPAPSWTWQYNLNLIGQDRLPVGETVSDLPPRAYEHHIQLRQWSWKYLQTLIGKDQMTVGDQITDLPPRDHLERYRSWTWNYNLNLVGQDKLPPGEIFTDRPPPVSWYQTWFVNLLQGTLATTVGKQFTDLPPRDHQERYRSWSWQYNVNLIGQDKLPVGEQVTDRPPPVTWYQTWVLNLLQGTLNVVQAPFNQNDWPLPKAPQQPAPSWTWNYNLNLIGQDKLPTGEIVTDLPPREALPNADRRTWAWSFALSLVGQDAMTTGEQVTDLPPRPHHRQPDLTTWLWNYNKNLVGQDILPTGDQRLELAPVGPQQPDRSWIVNLIQLLTAQIQNPFNQDDWPLPGQPAYQNDLRTWIDRTKLLLLVPFKQTDWPVPPPLTQPDRGFAISFPRTLIGQDRLPTGEQITDLPPRDHPERYRTWTWNYNLNLIGQDRLPVGEIVYDLSPRAYEHHVQLRAWLWAYNLNLIGKDFLPTGEIVTNLTPAGPVGGIDLRTWIDFTSLALQASAAALPFNQYAWPLPIVAGQPDRGLLAFYNLNLVGKDRFPPGIRITDLAPSGYIYPVDLRTMLDQFNLPLVPVIVPPPATERHDMPFLATPGQLKAW